MTAAASHPIAVITRRRALKAPSMQMSGFYMNYSQYPPPSLLASQASNDGTPQGIRINLRSDGRVGDTGGMGEPRSFRMDRRSPEAAREGGGIEEISLPWGITLMKSWRLWDYLSKEFMSKWTSEVESVGDHGDNLGGNIKIVFLQISMFIQLGLHRLKKLHFTRALIQSGNCTRATTNLSSLVTCSHEASSTISGLCNMNFRTRCQQIIPLQHLFKVSQIRRWDKLQRVCDLLLQASTYFLTCTELIFKYVNGSSAEEHQLQALSGKNSIETRLCAAAIDDESDQKTHPRGNVWDRLGRPPEGKQYQDFNFIEKKMDHQGAPQNPRLMRISTASGSTSGLRKQSFGTDRANDENPAPDEFKALDKLHRSNLKRRRQIGEFSSNNDASFCEENHLQNKARPTKLDVLPLPVNHDCQESVNKLSDMADSSVTSDVNFGSIKPACVLLDNKTSLFSQSQVNEQSSIMVPKENPATVCTMMPVKSESDNKIGVSNSIQKPVQDEVLSVKSRLHQVEMDMLKLRSKQVGLRNDGKPNVPSVTQNLPDEDIESRTVMVANVHFAATREALILHFAKCGAIAKVVMLTDAVTAMPKGAAYIVFANKESVSKAISLSGTSFFSRILKVVRKADVPPDFLVPSPPAMKQLQSFYPQAYRKFSTQKQQYTSSNLQWRRDQCTNRASPLTTSSTGLGSSNSGGLNDSFDGHAPIFKQLDFPTHTEGDEGSLV
ncbi:hypothetical protein HPP92_010425 [Vanilla planifolia]|uniref:RRM domain-containing protein n=1 Tax=Vanilla planifolia TaxID=51239 RepID=A0A835R3P4_VANPL|nr:hypothetical protein HPP92_010425 [Vanilla planifolia]